MVFEQPRDIRTDGRTNARESLGLQRLRRETQHRALVQLFFRLVHRNCLIFGTKVNLVNTYPLEILKCFDKFLITSNPSLYS